MPSLRQNAIISTWALVPFVLSCTILAVVLYHHNNRRPLTGKVGGDAVLWIAAAVVFFGSSFGMMALPIPTGGTKN